MAFSNKTFFTEQNALTMSLDFITNRLELKDTYLNQRYGLNRCTLSKIRRGESVTRVYKDFMHVFIKILHEQRLEYRKTMDFDRLNMIDHLLRDILLVEYGFATDEEISRFQK